MKQSVKCIKDFPPSTGIRYDEALWNMQHGDDLVIINCRASDIYYPEHWTPLSIKFAFTGKEYYILKNTTYAVSDNHFLVLNQGREYASYILSDTETESLTVNYTRQNINHLFAYGDRTDKHLLDDPFTFKNESGSFIEKLYDYNDEINPSVEKLKQLIAAEKPNSLALTEVLYHLLVDIYKLNYHAEQEIDTIDAIKYSTRKELYSRLTVAKDYLHSCFDQNITLEQLADTSYMNPFYLLRQFKKHFNVTPHQYLTAIRLQEAEKLIRNTGKNISEIVNEVGFEDVTSFGKLFKRKFGASPAQYRVSTNNTSK